MAFSESRGAAAHSNRRRDAKREAILRGARTVFLGSGFEGASMDTVAARAGVSKMTVYRHYGSKESLFAGVITDLCDHIVDNDLVGILEQPPRQALAKFAEKMIAITFAPDTIGLHRVVIAESHRFPQLGRLFYGAGPEVCIAALEGYFRRTKGQRGFKVRNPRRSAEEFLELLRGYAHLRVLLGIDKQPSTKEIQERIDSAIRHVVDVGPLKVSVRRDKA
jgi:TetR/AcrR family transcriptional repressor of mexJK operon